MYGYCLETLLLIPLGIYFEAPVLWPPAVKSQLLRKGPDDGGNCRQKEKGTTEDEMVGWHHQLNENAFEQAPGDGEGHGSLACCPAKSWT